MARSERALKEVLETGGDNKKNIAKRGLGYGPDVYLLQLLLS